MTQQLTTERRCHTTTDRAVSSSGDNTYRETNHWYEVWQYGELTGTQSEVYLGTDDEGGDVVATVYELRTAIPNAKGYLTNGKTEKYLREEDLIARVDWLTKHGAEAYDDGMMVQPKHQREGLRLRDRVRLARWRLRLRLS